MPKAQNIIQYLKSDYRFTIILSSCNYFHLKIHNSFTHYALSFALKTFL
jgi:hypothetical protein